MKDNVLEIIRGSDFESPLMTRPDTPRPPPPTPVNETRLSSFSRDIIKNNYNDHWVCCSKQIDRRAVQFFSQTLIIVGVMIVCLIHLGHENATCEETQTWMGLLTLLLGVLIPSPKFSK